MRSSFSAGLYPLNALDKFYGSFSMQKSNSIVGHNGPGNRRTSGDVFKARRFRARPGWPGG